jgi:hypothetical protein
MFNYVPNFSLGLVFCGGKEVKEMVFFGVKLCFYVWVRHRGVVFFGVVLHG